MMTEKAWNIRGREKKREKNISHSLASSLADRDIVNHKKFLVRDFVNLSTTRWVKHIKLYNRFQNLLRLEARMVGKIMKNSWVDADKERKHCHTVTEQIWLTHRDCRESAFLTRLETMISAISLLPLLDQDTVEDWEADCLWLQERNWEWQAHHEQK